ncbi:hypothetical protein [Sorangium sp. So ce176]|uniref:hypothetical protein n=1 Tax=Sorangium sp. So ce176 TaxID=3133286 RepID=UPI003F600D1B
MLGALHPHGEHGRHAADAQDLVDGPPEDHGRAERLVEAVDAVLAVPHELRPGRAVVRDEHEIEQRLAAGRGLVPHGAVVRDQDAPAAEQCHRAAGDLRADGVRAARVDLASGQGGTSAQVIGRRRLAGAARDVDDGQGRGRASAAGQRERGEQRGRGGERPTRRGRRGGACFFGLDHAEQAISAGRRAAPGAQPGALRARVDHVAMTFAHVMPKTTRRRAGFPGEQSALRYMLTFGALVVIMFSCRRR